MEVSLSRDGLPLIVNCLSVDITKRAVYRCFITPEVARVWLANYNEGTNQRSYIRPHWVSYLTECIREGQWAEDHTSSISFSELGRLLDGQHRLTAIVAAGIPVWSRVDFGVPRSVLAHLDNGLKRSDSDRNRFFEEPRQNQQANRLTRAFFRQISTNPPTPKEMESTYLQHQASIGWMAKKAGQKRRGFDRVYFLLACCEFYERSPRLAEEFYASVAEPDGPIQPARRLRDYILRIPSHSGQAADQELRQRSIYCMLAYTQKREISSVRCSLWPENEKL